MRLAPTTIEALDGHRRAQVRKSGLRTLVFPDRDGGYLRRQNFDRRSFAVALRKASEQSGLDFSGHTFHDLRHTMATLLLSEGEAITRVSQRLGHASVKTTWDYYAHCVPQDEDRPAIRFEERMRAHRVFKIDPAIDPATTRRSPQTFMPRARIELATPGFSDLCSTD